MRSLLVSLFLTFCLGGVTYAQIQKPTLGSVGVQRIQTLIITEDGTALSSSVTPRSDEDIEKLVMWLSGEPFSERGTGGTGDVYDDYIWIKTGSLRNGSILAADIEGGLTKVGVVPDNATCPSVDGPGGVTLAAIIGFNPSTGEPICLGNEHLPKHWKYSDGAVYRDSASFSDTTIYVGKHPKTDNSTATVSVAGVAQIADDGTKTATLRVVNGADGGGGVITPGSINTEGSHQIIIGKNSTDQIGIGTAPIGAATLTISGTTTTQGSWTVYDDVDTNTNKLAIQPTDTGVVFSSDNPIVFSKGKSSSNVASRPIWSRRATAAGSDIDVALVVDCSWGFSKMCSVSTTASAPVSVSHKNASNVTTMVMNSATSGFGWIAKDSVPFSTLSLQSGGGVIGSLAYNSVGVPRSSTLEIVSATGGVTYATLYHKDTMRVMMGFTPPSNDKPTANLTTHGGVQIDQLQLSNLSPTNTIYKTLEQVDCKLLTLDSSGQMQLVDYMPERCRRGISTPTTTTYSRDLGEWSECVATASGTFQKERTVQCVDDNTGDVVANNNCQSAMPPSTSTCDSIKTYTRQASWSECVTRTSITGGSCSSNGITSCYGKGHNDIDYCSSLAGPGFGSDGTCGSHRIYDFSCGAGKDAGFIVVSDWIYENELNRISTISSCESSPLLEKPSYIHSNQNSAQIFIDDIEGLNYCGSNGNLSCSYRRQVVGACSWGVESQRSCALYDESTCRRHRGCNRSPTSTSQSTQTKTYQCVDQDGEVVDDALCVAAKPRDDQALHSCTPNASYVFSFSGSVSQSDYSSLDGCTSYTISFDIISTKDGQPQEFTLSLPPGLTSTKQHTGGGTWKVFLSVPQNTTKNSRSFGIITQNASNKQLLLGAEQDVCASSL